MIFMFIFIKDFKDISDNYSSTNAEILINP